VIFSRQPAYARHAFTRDEARDAVTPFNPASCKLPSSRGARKSFSFCIYAKHRGVPSLTCSMVIPYTVVQCLDLTPLFATLTKIAGVYLLSSQNGTKHLREISPTTILLRVLAPSGLSAVGSSTNHQLAPSLEGARITSHSHPCYNLQSTPSRRLLTHVHEDQQSTRPPGS